MVLRIWQVLAVVYNERGGIATVRAALCRAEIAEGTTFRCLERNIANKAAVPYYKIKCATFSDVTLLEVRDLTIKEALDLELICLVEAGICIQGICTNIPRIMGDGRIFYEENYAVIANVTATAPVFYIITALGYFYKCSWNVVKSTVECAYFSNRVQEQYFMEKVCNDESVVAFACTSSNIPIERKQRHRFLTFTSNCTHPSDMLDVLSCAELLKNSSGIYKEKFDNLRNSADLLLGTNNDLQVQLLDTSGDALVSKYRGALYIKSMITSSHLVIPEGIEALTLSFNYTDYLRSVVLPRSALALYLLVSTSWDLLNIGLTAPLSYYKASVFRCNTARDAMLPVCARSLAERGNAFITLTHIAKVLDVLDCSNSYRGLQSFSLTFGQNTPAKQLCLPTADEIVLDMKRDTSVCDIAFKETRIFADIEARYLPVIRANIAFVYGTTAQQLMSDSNGTCIDTRLSFKNMNKAFVHITREGEDSSVSVFALDTWKTSPARSAIIITDADCVSKLRIDTLLRADECIQGEGVLPCLNIRFLHVQLDAVNYYGGDMHKSDAAVLNIDVHVQNLDLDFEPFHREKNQNKSHSVCEWMRRQIYCIKGVDVLCLTTHKIRSIVDSNNYEVGKRLNSVIPPICVHVKKGTKQALIEASVASGVLKNRVSKVLCDCGIEIYKGYLERVIVDDL